MRWVTKNVEVDRKEYLDGQGVLQSFRIVEKRRVLQQCVQTSWEPGYEWVDVPEVTDES